LTRAPIAHPRRAWGFAGLALLAASSVALLALYRANPKLDPIATPISFYIGGSNIWLLRLMLATDGLGVLTIAWSLEGQRVSINAVRLIAIAGAGLVLAAFVNSDLWFPWQRRLTLAGWLHAIGAGSAVLTFPVAAVLFTRAMQPRTLLTRILDGLNYIFIAVLLGFGAMTLIFAIIGRAPGFLGLAEQLLFTLAGMWLIVATRSIDYRKE
jgi:hypothetical protein